MATYTGELVSHNSSFDLDQEGDSFVDSVESTAYLEGVISPSGYTPSDRVYVGEPVQEDALNSLWNRIWFSPLSHDAGFIVEESVVDIEIWNAFIEASKTISSIVTSNASGTSLNASAPITLRPLEDVTHELTIAAEGPAVQSTTYTYTIAGDTYVISIRGLRLENFIFLPNWKDKVKFELGHHTAVNQALSFKEQRRPLQEVPQRIIEVTFLKRGRDAQKIHNHILGLKNTVVGVPVFTELMTTGSDISSATTITVQETVTYYWNLQNQCQYILVLDLENNVSEIKEISSIDGSDINLQNAITKTFDHTKVKIFPMMLAFIDYTPAWKNGGVLEAKVTFKEAQF